tara:strand:+ start:53 stop:553 length:501 start_codon:yes stop_codon:yes gene_type:complete
MSRTQTIRSLIRQFGRDKKIFTSQFSRRISQTPYLFNNTPNDYNDPQFWIKYLDMNQYAYGIRDEFMEEYGYPQMAFLEVDLGDILMKGDIFAVIENEKAVVSLESPFDNARVLEFDEDIDFDIVIDDPENIDNKIAVFEEIVTEDTHQFLGGAGGNTPVYQMAHL